jgi:hypothetical protein
MWPFSRRARAVNVDEVVDRVMDQAINRLMVQILTSADRWLPAIQQFLRPPSADVSAEMAKLTTDLLRASGENHIAEIKARSEARAAAAARRARGPDGKFQRSTPRGPQPEPCRVCKNAGDPSLSAAEILTHYRHTNMPNGGSA